MNQFFDNNTRDLQVLDALVVTNITQFYIYLKAMRDTWRKLARATTREERLEILRNVIYMQFLAFENARSAVAELIEFEPNEADNTLVVLLSELPAFCFLLDKFPESDLRRRRLALRIAAYRADVPEIVCRVMSHSDEQWAKLQETAKQLALCYESLFKDKIDAVPCETRVSVIRERQVDRRRMMGSHAGGPLSPVPR